MKHIIIGAFLGIIAGYFTPYLNTFNFPLGFTFIGLGLGITFHKYISGTGNLLEKLFWIYVFTVSALAYSGILNLRYHTSMRISEVPFFILFFAIAVSVFVFIFCVALLSLQDAFRSFVYGIAAAMTLSGLLLFLIDYLWLPSFLASFLVCTAMFAITTSHFFKEKIKNIGLNIVVLFLIYVVGVLTLPLAPYLHSIEYLTAMILAILIIAIAICLIGNALYFIDRQSGKFQGKISLSWLASFSALLCNYAIFPSIFCILVYRRTAELLVRQGQLSTLDLRIALRLSITTLVIHLIFMICYETFLASIWTDTCTNMQLLGNMVIWGLCAALASHSLGKCITEHQRAI